MGEGGNFRFELGSAYVGRLLIRDWDKRDKWKKAGMI